MDGSFSLLEFIMGKFKEGHFSSIYVCVQKDAWHLPEGKCHILCRHRRMLCQYHVARPLT